jgi:hypothetical protein
MHEYRYAAGEGAVVLVAVAAAGITRETERPHLHDVSMFCDPSMSWHWRKRCINTQDHGSFSEMVDVPGVPLAKLSRSKEIPLLIAC